MIIGQFVALLLASGLSPSADAQPQCPVRYATKFATHFADLPEPIRKDILQDGKVAAAGEVFEPYDNITDPSLPRRRFVMAGLSGDKWFVWIDHGGFSRHDDVFGYRKVWEKVDKFQWYRAAELQGDPCIAVNAFLDGIWTPTQGK